LTSLTAFKILLVDFDGVLAKLDVNWNEVKARVSRELGIPVESLTMLLRQVWGTELYWKISRIIEEYELKALPRAKPLHGSIEGLYYAKGLRLKVYIASFQSESVIRGFLQAWKLDSIIEGIYSREFAPWKAVMTLAVAAVEKVSPAAILFVDDNEHNLREVEAVGARTINPNGFRNLHEALRACCDRSSRYQ
jgi:beta-phosphoglucomutase-like phosphatase (HAD superfamily)